MSFLKRATVLLNALSLSSALNTVAVSPTDWSIFVNRALIFVQRQSGGIQWSDCVDFSGGDYTYASEPNIQCGFFDVPLDWNNTSLGIGRIAVAKYSATGTKAGTLFTNPGAFDTTFRVFGSILTGLHKPRWTRKFRCPGHLGGR